MINILVLSLIWLDRDQLFSWIASDQDRNPMIMILILTIIAAVPGIPYGIVGGIVGAKYGIIEGSIYNLIISSLAAAAIYGVTRYLLQSWGRALLAKSNMIERCNRMIHNHLFWSLIIARMIPVLPAVAINIYAGVFRIPFGTFIMTTFIGKIPIMVVYAYVGDNLWSGAYQWVMVIAIYLGFLTIVYSIYKLFLMRRSS
ncbi:TVP38/TMEM64 family protein [Paenibacillus terrigena]|uniref:TVP38/TMEM64 family protein n=1 Tax=Paenibacillus terrigena TaxID=369333 RepID=UPI00037022F8|nr:VTT domain-containing protein [Paenibacillus terrigena]